MVEKTRPSTNMSRGDKYRLYYLNGKRFVSRKKVDEYLQRMAEQGVSRVCFGRLSTGVRRETVVG